jgi:hypothetical protein
MAEMHIDEEIESADNGGGNGGGSNGHEEDRNVAAGKIAVTDPKDVIKLDDDEFGKF